MHYVVINAAGAFWTGFHWSAEYPDARLLRRTGALNVALVQGGAAVWQYGTAEQEIVADYRGGDQPGVTTC